VKKSTISVLIPFLIIIFLIPFATYAQDDDGYNTVLMVKQIFNYNEGNTVAEFDSISTIWDENIVKNNKYIVSQMTLGHYYGSNSSEFIVITEYNGSGLDIIEKAGDETTRLYKEWMPESEDRKELNGLFSKYFTIWHSDEILTMFSKVTN